MADERILPTSLGSTFSSNLTAMATSAAQSSPPATALRGGGNAGMTNSQLVQALGHDYSSLRPPYLGTQNHANELAAHNLVQHMLQVGNYHEICCIDVKTFKVRGKYIVIIITSY